MPSFTPVTVGSLDPAFGSGGQLTAPFSTTGGYLTATAMQSNGQIVAGGQNQSGPGSTYARYHANGSLDTSFGSNGFIAVPFTANAIAIEPDGNMIVAGSTRLRGGTTDFALAEFNSSGSLNTRFGTNGLVTTDFHGGDDGLFALAIQGNGDIVAAGVTFQQPGNIGNFAVARYSEAGALDSSFGAGGLVITNFGDKFDAAQAVAIQANGQIVVVGAGFVPAGYPTFEIARYNTDGSLDANFGTAGLVITNFPSGTANAYAVAFQSNGAILVGGTVWGPNHSFEFALARYQSNGALDPTFGSGGLVATNIGGQDDELYGLAIQANGQILAAGTSASAANGNHLALVRYHTDGSLDTAFATGGRGTTDFGGDDYEALAIHLQSDGSILAIGYTCQENTSQLALARYLVNPNEIYVDNLYQLLLHRPADTGSAYWLNLLDRGESPAAIVLGIEQSPEYLNNVVTSLYEHYLLRAPDAGAQHWVSTLENGATIEQVIDGIVGSSEFFQNEGGGTNGGYLTALYQYILNRPADADGYASWLDALNHGTSRAAAAAGFLASREYQTDLVGSYYLQFLHRPADDPGLSNWVDALQDGTTDRVMLAGILGSAECFNDWS